MQIIKYSKWYIILSLVVLIPGIVSLVLFRLNLAIDFTGGAVIDYKLSQPVERNVIETEMNSAYESKGFKVESIGIDAQTVTVRTKPMESAQADAIKKQLETKFTGITQDSFETIGPSVGQETTKTSFIALSVASLGILLYIAFAFRNVPKPYSGFRFGACAIIAMLHDAFVVLGVFSILGHFLKVEIDSLFITAVLTVIGFSVHDTIVVFDRIRENLKKLPQGWKFSDVVNYSLVETLNRSLATSLTVIFTLLALFLLGGVSIKYFVLALLIGIISGTYSSIFNAAPILVYWESWLGRRKSRLKK